MFYYRGQEYDVRIAEKPFLSLNEAIVLTGIGEKKLVQLSLIHI